MPTVAPGRYLWTRQVLRFNTGDPITSYSVSRFGIDGTGAVSSVAGVAPDENGNVPLDAADVKALPIGGGTMEGSIDMNGQRLTGLNAPTADDEPATKGYADNLKPDLTGYATETYVNNAVKSAAPRNLLDNSDFTNPVNQRGEASYTVNGYTIDRWYASKWQNGATAQMTVAVEDGGLRISGGAAGISNACCIEQRLLATGLGGKTLTLAIKSKEVSSEQANLINIFCDGTRVKYAELASDRISITTFSVPTGTEKIAIRIGNSASEGGKGIINALLEWAALYEGEYTEETLPEYQTKCYGAELRECQRYYFNSWFGSTKNAAHQLLGQVWSDAQADFPIDFPQQMRINPTVTFYGSVNREKPNVYNGAYYEVHDIAVNNRLGLNGTYARVTKGSADASTWTVGNTIQLHAHYDASADL